MTLPEFARPPLVETALAVQFAPLPKLTVAHLGVFALELGPEWQELIEAPALGQMSEPITLEHWLGSAVPVEVMAGAPVRLRIVRSTRDRMIQVENGWLVYNWRRTPAENEYVRYQTVRSEFDALVSTFMEFLGSRSLGEFQPNLWEVIYVNFIAKGGAWQRVGDWHRVLPTLLGPMREDGSTSLQTMAGSWTYVLGQGLGRLHVIVQHAGTVEERLLLKLVARGHTTTPTLTALDAGLNLGHRVIVQKFTDITSEEAHHLWSRRT